MPRATRGRPRIDITDDLCLLLRVDAEIRRIRECYGLPHRPVSAVDLAEAIGVGRHKVTSSLIELVEAGAIEMVAPGSPSISPRYEVVGADGGRALEPAYGEGGAEIPRVAYPLSAVEEP